MMRRMLRKPISHSCGVLIFCAVYVATLSAQPCIPSSEQTKETDGNCILGNNPPWDSANTNVKLVYYLVTWPDNVSGQQTNNGNGQCHLGYQCNGSYNWDVYCWAYFDDPVTSDGHWSQNVQDAMYTGGSTAPCPGGNNYQVTLPTCQGNGTFRLANQQHTCQWSPIIIDAKAEGFHLTSVENGVRFALSAQLGPAALAWTDPAYSNGWLALDRNHNGKIDDLTELFGNLTPQPESSNPNGYAALAVFDEPRNGGNANGTIDPGDAIYWELRLWIDHNHNGVSEPEELIPLQAAGIFSIDLTYFPANIVDQFGNLFRYRAHITDTSMRKAPLCYDVFLLKQ